MPRDDAVPPSSFVVSKSQGRAPQIPRQPMGGCAYGLASCLTNFFGSATSPNDKKLRNIASCGVRTESSTLPRRACPWAEGRVLVPTRHCERIGHGWDAVLPARRNMQEGKKARSRVLLSRVKAFLRWLHEEKKRTHKWSNQVRVVEHLHSRSRQ